MGDRAGTDEQSPYGNDAVTVMGILNVTPDSFSDGGLHDRLDSAVARAREMAAQGAAIIDVGGESTRPGASPVDAAQEMSRVIPVVEALAGTFDVSGLRISIDTRNEATARAAVAAGATLINDVSASLWPVAADTGAGWVAMHMSGDPRTMQANPHYGYVVDEVRRFLVGRATTAVAAGVEEVWVDPGIGFGKTTSHNVDLLAHIDVLVDEGFPVLVGTSRKRFLGELTTRSDLRGDPGGSIAEPTGVADRLEASLVSAMWAVLGGVRAVRVHDVGATVNALRSLG